MLINSLQTSKEMMKKPDAETVEVIAASSNLTKEQLIDAVAKINETDSSRLVQLVQVFDADSIAGPMHVKFAFFHALKAFENKRNIMRNRALEILLRAACSRQIRKATEIVGVKEPTNIVIGFIGNKKQILRLLRATEKRSILTQKKDEEQKLIQKMVLLQLD